MLFDYTKNAPENLWYKIFLAVPSRFAYVILSLSSFLLFILSP